MARRWFVYLVVNILVSAATMLTVMYFWDRSRRSEPLSLPTLTPLPSDQATTTPPPPPTATPIIYTVAQGDTLGSIAASFGVDVDELIQWNGIVDPDSLDVGMTLIIPPGAGNISPAARIPTVTPQTGEIFPWPVVDGMQAMGNLDREAVRITNPGPTAVLTGWRIRTPGGTEYVFGKFSLVSQGAVWLYSGSGVDTSIDLYWGLTEPVWNPGDEVLLLDSLGNVRSVFIIP